MAREFMTPAEVAHILKISYRKVLDLIKKGDLGAFEVDKQYRITWDNIDKYQKDNGVSFDNGTTTD